LIAALVIYLALVDDTDITVYELGLC